MASSTMNDPAGSNAAWMTRGVVHAARPPLGAARKLGRLVVRALLVLSVLAFVTVAVGPRFGLYRPLTVLSGSMRPTFNPGDLVIVRPEPLRDVRAGQVIAYQVPVGVHQVETHRIVRVLHGGAHPVVQTKGDANNVRDPWTAKLSGTTAWRLAVVVPYGGYVINALRSRELHFAALVVAPGLVALLLLANLWGVLPRRRRTGDVAA
jgi:signal peptidase